MKYFSKVKFINLLLNFIDIILKIIKIIAIFRKCNIYNFYYIKVNISNFFNIFKYRIIIRYYQIYFQTILKN